MDNTQLIHHLELTADLEASEEFKELSEKFVLAEAGVSTILYRYDNGQHGNVSI